jgi:hypothetical protein
MYFSKRAIKQTVSHVREGWYGNGDTYPEGDLYRKAPVDCALVDCGKLFQECVRAAATKFIPLCEGISGTIGDLKINETYQEEEIDIPIDALVLDLARFNDEGGASEAQS